jgi:hypothetical protein
VILSSGLSSTAFDAAVVHINFTKY